MFHNKIIENCLVAPILLNFQDTAASTLPFPGVYINIPW
jgi:hypothetical protein